VVSQSDDDRATGQKTWPPAGESVDGSDGRTDEPVWVRQSTWPPPEPEPLWRSVGRKLWAPIAALGLLLWKLKAAAVVVFKFKIFTTAGTMLVSIGAYALIWGWRFAIGFVLLLLVHELGHALEAKRQGLDVSAPLFIPFLGAVIAMKELPHDVWREFKIAIAGPALGSVGAAVVWLAGEWTGSDLLIALGFTGFFLNLFNLLPVSPLDGGRIVAAIHPAIWAVGLAALLVLVIIAPNPILILILLVGGLEVWRRWQARGTEGGAEYYQVSRRQRVIAAVSYLGLIALLGLAMGASHIERNFGDS
jgi:Zn-dependent protease